MYSHSQGNMSPLCEAHSREKDHCLEDEACIETDSVAELLSKQKIRVEWEGSHEQLVWNTVSLGLALESPPRLWKVRWHPLSSDRKGAGPEGKQGR